MVTPELFRRYPTPEAMARAPLPALEKIIRSTGFFRQKAKSLKGTATGILERFGGEVPRTLAELTTLPGVARKTANVVLGTAFGLAEGIVVDTHIQRLAMRLALTRAVDAKGIEQDLIKVLPHESWCPIRIQLSCGSTFIRSCSIPFASLARVRPSRIASRCTWVSTTTPSAIPYAVPSTTLPVLRATPGSLVSSASVFGMVPPC